MPEVPLRQRWKSGSRFPLTFIETIRAGEQSVRWNTPLTGFKFYEVLQDDGKIKER